MTTAQALDFSFPAVAAVIGCGGKTSLIARAAGGYPGRRVLISPTTKMRAMSIEGADFRGRPNPVTGKTEALSEAELAALLPNYAVTLLEADGSAGLPCKGWRDTEPVIPPFVTHTVGVVTLNALGRPADTARVHRLPLFLALTGLREGDPITHAALERMLCAPGGMFRNSVGKRLLFVNQVESCGAEAEARALLALVAKNNPGFFSRMALGSVHGDRWALFA